jgi:hypothetical protein
VAEDAVDNDDDLTDLYPDPMEITTYRHAVVVTGPTPNNLAMTADAAERSAALLLEAARQARSAR